MKNKNVSIHKQFAILILALIFLTSCMLLGYEDADLLELHNVHNYDINIVPINSEEIVSSLAFDYISETLYVNKSCNNDNVSLRESMFLGTGEFMSEGGAELEWFIHMFAGSRVHLIHSIPIELIHFVGIEEWDNWREQFVGHGANGWRDRREIHLISFIEDFDLSIEDFIMIEELVFGKPISEIDALVTGARTGNFPAELDEFNLGASLWMSFRSLSDIEALFSNDINVVWESFPGSGVLLSNRAYTPE